MVMPVVSAHLSAPQFTFWLFANSIIAIGILFETSVSVVFTRTLTAYIERRSLANVAEVKEANDRIAGFICTSSILYIVVGIIGGFVSYIAGIQSIEGLIEIGLDISEAHNAMLALSFIACSSILLSFGRSVLIANQQMRTQRIIMLLTTVSKLLISIAIFSTLPRVDVAMAAVGILNTVETVMVTVLSWSVQRLAVRSRPNLKFMDEFAVPFVKTFLIRIGGYLSMYSSSIIIVRYTPAVADAFLLSLRLVQAAGSVSLIPVSISLPALTRLRARIIANKRSFSTFVEAALGIIVFGMICMILMLLGLILLGPKLLELTTNGKTLLQTGALAYMCLIFLLESHHIAHAMVYETQNRVPFLGISIVSGIAILIFSMILVPHFGVWGALIALNLVQLSANNWVPVWLNLRQWGLSWANYFRIFARMGLMSYKSKLLDPDA